MRADGDDDPEVASRAGSEHGATVRTGAECILEPKLATPCSRAPLRLRRLGQLLQGPAGYSRSSGFPTSGSPSTSSPATRSPTSSGGSTRRARRPCWSTTDEEQSAGVRRDPPLPRRGDRAPPGRPGGAGSGLPLARLRAGRRDPGVAGLPLPHSDGRRRSRTTTAAEGEVSCASRSCWASSRITCSRRDFIVGSAYSVADISVYGYVPRGGRGRVRHNAPRCAPGSNAWRPQPGYMNDLEPYPANAHVGASRSTYDTAG